MPVVLSTEQIEALDGYCKREGISRSDAMRRAIDSFIPIRQDSNPGPSKDPAFGSSKDDDKIDSVEIVRRLRGEWDR